MLKQMACTAFRASPAELLALKLDKQALHLDAATVFWVWLTRDIGNLLKIYSWELMFACAGKDKSFSTNGKAPDLRPDAID